MIMYLCVCVCTWEREERRVFFLLSKTFLAPLEWKERSINQQLMDGLESHEYTDGDWLYQDSFGIFVGTVCPLLVLPDAYLIVKWGRLTDRDVDIPFCLSVVLLSFFCWLQWTSPAAAAAAASTRSEVIFSLAPIYCTYTHIYVYYIFINPRWFMHHPILQAGFPSAHSD